MLAISTEVRCYSSRQRKNDTKDDSQNANLTTGSEHKGLRVEVSKCGTPSLVQVSQKTLAQCLGGRGGAAHRRLKHRMCLLVSLGQGNPEEPKSRDPSLEELL